MFDIHYVPENWGVAPKLMGISTYTIFVTLGIVAAIVFYFLDSKKRGVKSEGVVVIVAAALIFGTIGAKLPILIANYQYFGRPDIWFEGKTIVGGFIGGILGVLLAKRVFKIKLKMGNVIAPAVALGLGIGRLGCFFNGCCYGKPSSWGTNFGDGILRLPTQLFESAFHFTAFFILLYCRNKVTTPGILFKYYISAYLIFRLFCEFFRENQVVFLGLTLYQILCLAGLILVNYRLLFKGKTYGKAKNIEKECLK